MKIKLKPCPFCGGYPNVEYVDDKTQVYMVCSECGIEQDLYKSLDKALEAWNRRVIEEVHYGKWSEDDYGYYHCFECGFEHDSPEYTTLYCPECGAKMEVEE